MNRVAPYHTPCTIIITISESTTPALRTLVHVHTAHVPVLVYGVGHTLHLNRVHMHMVHVHLHMVHMNLHRVHVRGVHMHVRDT